MAGRVGEVGGWGRLHQPHLGPRHILRQREGGDLPQGDNREPVPENIPERRRVTEH